MTRLDGGLAVSEWQKIETAPKDGTDVLVYGPTCWRVTICRWHERDEWWETGTDFITYNDLTHWMPLPEPPVAA